jgi:ASC-1-like (ASCH) protein
MSIYEKTVSEPWFTLIKLGIKTVEGRQNKGDCALMKIGDFIIFTNNELGFLRQFKKEITHISFYYNFKTYLESEMLSSCLPGIDTIEEGLHVYLKYYPENHQYMIKAFRF